jgi:hypothetical protein
VLLLVGDADAYDPQRPTGKQSRTGSYSGGTVLLPGGLITCPAGLPASSLIIRESSRLCQPPQKYVDRVFWGLYDQ